MEGKWSGRWEGLDGKIIGKVGGFEGKWSAGWDWEGLDWKRIGRCMGRVGWTRVREGRWVVGKRSGKVGSWMGKSLGRPAVLWEKSGRLEVGLRTKKV